MSKFNLVEERKKLFQIMLKEVPTKAGRFYRIIVKQDKEFIRLLKEELGDLWTYSGEWASVESKIDKLAGKEKE